MGVRVHLCGAERVVLCPGLVGFAQMEEEGVPSTALREVSLLQMLNETVFIVR